MGTRDGSFSLQGETSELCAEGCLHQLQGRDTQEPRGTVRLEGLSPLLGRAGAVGGGWGLPPAWKLRMHQTPEGRARLESSSQATIRLRREHYRDLLLTAFQPHLPIIRLECRGIKALPANAGKYFQVAPCVGSQGRNPIPDVCRFPWCVYSTMANLNGQLDVTECGTGSRHVQSWL